MGVCGDESEGGSEDVSERESEAIAKEKYSLLPRGDDLGLELLVAALELGLKLLDALREAALNVRLGGLKLLVLKIRLRRTVVKTR